MKISFSEKQKGYTIIETIIAVSIFSVVATAGMAALLQANVAHQKSQDMRSIIDNLSFIMEEVSRNIRTSYGYRCIPGTFSNAAIETPQSCATGKSLAFEYSAGSGSGVPGNPSDQWVYKIEGPNISKSVNGGANGTWIQLNPSEVVLDAASSFMVLGAEPPPGNTQQPLVIIKLVGSITYKNITSPFSIETAVSQRLIDVP